MKIVVLVKVVPDTYGDRKLDLETGLADRGASERVLDEICERALGVAVAYADEHPDTEVVALSMGPEGSSTGIRKALAMGASSATQILDEALIGADLGLTAEVIAAALERIGFDLIIAGNSSTDGSGSVLPGMLAERLDLPQLTQLSRVELAVDRVSGTRAGTAATTEVSADLPAVISITDALPDSRFPSFKDIMAAKKKPFETLTIADLRVDALAPDTPRAIMTAVSERPPRGAGVKVVDDGDGGKRLAAFLIENRLA